MATEVILPKLGLTMEEATIVNWLKSEGDPVENGEAILEIETDKSSVEVEAPASGELGPILFKEGSVVPIGKTITYVIGPGEEIPSEESAPKTATAEEAQGKKDKPEPQPPDSKSPDGRIVASPIARRIAKELGVDLASVVGTGPKGRIMEEDVRLAASKGEPSEPLSPSDLSPAGEARPLGTIRRLTAERMVQSFTSAPHYYLSVEADASLLIEMRQALIPTVEKQTGTRPTVSDLLIKITAQALDEHPEVNTTWDAEGIRNISEINVGLAVATDRGLVVPVFHQANRMSLAEVAARRQTLVEKARDGVLGLPDLEGGSFTLTNLGVYAVDQFNAIINPPQAAILAVGRIKERPAAVDGELVIRPTIFLSLSVDHRILDGSEAARFLDRLVTLLESPFLITSIW